MERKVVEQYFVILEDLLLAHRLPIFSKRAKRRMLQHPKFYLFDAGVYRTIRPKGPLDSPEEIDGIALETLFFQELRALNDYLALDSKLFYWKTSAGLEVDFILYGEKGLCAFEVKRTGKIRSEWFRGLHAFRKDYPMAKTYFIYCGDRELREGPIEVLPFTTALKRLPNIIA